MWRGYQGEGSVCDSWTQDSTPITVPAAGTQALETTRGWTAPTTSPSSATLWAGTRHDIFITVMETDQDLVRRGWGSFKYRVQIPRQKLCLIRRLGNMESLVQSMRSQLPDCGILYVFLLQKMKSFLGEPFILNYEQILILQGKGTVWIRGCHAAFMFKFKNIPWRYSPSLNTRGSVKYHTVQNWIWCRLADILMLYWFCANQSLLMNPPRVLILAFSRGTQELKILNNLIDSY